MCNILPLFIFIMQIFLLFFIFYYACFYFCNVINVGIFCVSQLAINHSIVNLNADIILWIFCVEGIYVLGQEVSIGPVWPGVHAEGFSIRNEIVRSIASPCRTFSLDLGGLQTERLVVIGVLFLIEGSTWTQLTFTCGMSFTGLVICGFVRTGYQTFFFTGYQTFNIPLSIKFYKKYQRYQTREMCLLLPQKISTKSTAGQ